MNLLLERNAKVDVQGPLFGAPLHVAGLMYTTDKVSCWKSGGQGQIQYVRYQRGINLGEPLMLHFSGEMKNWRKFVGRKDSKNTNGFFSVYYNTDNKLFFLKLDSPRLIMGCLIQLNRMMLTMALLFSTFNSRIFFFLCSIQQRYLYVADDAFYFLNSLAILGKNLEVRHVYCPRLMMNLFINAIATRNSKQY
ncbi:hypothetical protein GYMLUDRAFT_58866 [Collybiopsis luxurians FD-317 M1]|uniref:Uncharacterized protein n=1 Tax=Collybiopsis luxurians FD-317 M1 TaxID=944289 RepID=A0A0D0CY99_9AGAR|nr:hypothetical protein GYMLUDRAFT_58866 [Collybiopsis luxurians FD-317 M1]